MASNFTLVSFLSGIFSQPATHNAP